MEKLKYILGWILIFLFNVFSWASDTESETDDYGFEHDNANSLPGYSEGTEAPPNVPIDMYEGILIAVAIMLILGYYYYTTQKNKMVKS